MTTAQIEQRLAILEKTVARLQTKLGDEPEEILREEDIIDGVEYDLTPTLKSNKSQRFQGRVVKGKKRILPLALTEAEWDALSDEETDE